MPSDEEPTPLRQIGDLSDSQLIENVKILNDEANEQWDKNVV